ncbi:hypothetical protein MJ575_09000 [Klebsiella pneumoniae]|nr:hypothetical protein MJ575_09000 [Klebsiella pneumoniae]
MVNLKRQATHTPLRSLFDEASGLAKPAVSCSATLSRLSQGTAAPGGDLLTRAELTFKQDYGHDVWPELESLSLLLCHKALADVFY